MGSYLAKYLTKLGEEVTVFDKLGGQMVGDITNHDDVQRVFEKIGPFETVYHLASYSQPL